MDEDQSLPQDLFLGAAPHQFAFAKVLRAHETSAEKILWSKLNRKQLGVKFRRQQPLHDYIIDFYCHSHRLAIEIDGDIHNTSQNKNYDECRDQTLLEFGIRTIRFSNNDVVYQIEVVINQIKDALLTRPPKSP